MIGRPIVLKDWTMDAWNCSLKSLNDIVDIAFYGHSIIHFGEWQNYFPEYKVVNLGLACQNIDGMRKRVDQLSYVHPKIIVVMAGTNTIGLFSLQECQSKFSDLLLSIREALPTSRIVVHDVLPVRG